ncbi:MAG: hypothetical protein F6K42_14695 [Leptolyngbya sp. SIO1D8]|nr:hypothetical protein [Leptolyngbya sp. SIO1D8]
MLTNTLKDIPVYEATFRRGRVTFQRKFAALSEEKLDTQVSIYAQHHGLECTGYSLTGISDPEREAS